jgi:Bacterial lectin/Bacterial Ig-like domain (group 3)/Abnormal spindle-like microcephaly-assoc'd, ASPM-SPD-2-Hydin
MTSRSFRRVLSAIALIMGLLFFANAGFAQQITYYDFDAPQAAMNGSSLACADPAKVPTAPTNPLFCFNNGGGSNPGFLSAVYPPIIDPDPPTDPPTPPIPTTHFDTQLTAPFGAQASSMWFSVPQKISNGFTSYFAFRITPDQQQQSFATADGIAFVIQNASGHGKDSIPCSEIGSGPNAVGGQGGCIGYGGIDNSLVFELDTFLNAWDPQDSFVSPYINSPSNDNHIAIQNCGAGLGNSPDHTGSCLVKLNNGTLGAINGALSNTLPPVTPGGASTLVPVTLADGNVHQVIIEYSGPTEAIPNQLQVFIDPPLVPETHTPAPGALPVIVGTYDISANLNLMNSGSANDSAYVGFTSATGGAFEQQELMAWTFTPHTPVTQQQPISPPGVPTTFPFGSHTYAVTYPVGQTGTSEIDMVVTANTIAPALFTQLISNTPFSGSVCQIYDETGGNCVVYSTSCLIHGTTTPVQCPPSSSSDPDTLISLKSAYNNSIPPISPGFLKGDPFYSLIASISGDGTTATVTCTGECAVTAGQAVTIAGNLNGSSPSGFNGPVTVLSSSAPNTFTFASASSGPSTGGYVTSNNLQNVFATFVPQRIDGTTTGRTKNFSDFVVTSVTSAVTSMTITAPGIAFGNAAPVTVAVTSAGGTPPGNVSLTVDGGAPQTSPLSSGSAAFAIAGLSGGPHALVATYTAQGIFQGAIQTTSLTVTKGGSVTIASGTPNPSAAGAAVAVAVTVAGNGVPAGAPAPSGNFSVTSGAGGPTCGGTLSAGTGSCSLTFLTAGVQSITVVYSGDGNYAGSQTTTPQTVNGSVASVSPSSINFGTVYVATLSIRSVTLTNVGNTSMTIKEKFLSIIGGGNSNEFIALSLCPSTLQAGKSCTILVSFIAGPTYTPQNAVLMINDSAPNSPQSVPLSANVINPQASFSPSPLGFGTVGVGSAAQMPLTITNPGNTPLIITSLGVSGANASDFTIINNTCAAPVAARLSCSVTVRFVPGHSGARNATLRVSDNVWNGSQQVALTGKGK